MINNSIKSIAYRAIDIATFGKGIKRNFSGEPVKFPARWSRYFPSDYEPETVAFLRDHLHEGKTFLDIGAHIGLFAVIAANRVGRTGKVICFEPTPFTRKVLSEVVGLNGCLDRVEIRSEAVSSGRGRVTFFDSGDALSVVNSLVRSEISQGEYEVETTSIDDIVDEEMLAIDCIKVDVEGAELELLNGASKTLTAMRPTVRLSLHPPFLSERESTMQAIWSKIKEHDYSVIYEKREVEKDWFCENRDLFDVNLIPN